MGTHPIFESDFDCLTVRMVEFKQELEDLLSEHQFISINLIASELNVHVNKAKSILTKYAENTKHVRFYYLSGLVENKLKLLITRERENEVKNFEKLFSSHIYALATDDFEFDNYVRNIIPACHAVRETHGNNPKAKIQTKSTTQVKDTSQDIFKKKEVPKKGVAKAFSKIEPKSSSVKKEANDKPTVKKEVPKNKPNQKVNSFFGKKAEAKKPKKETKKIEPEDTTEEPEENEAMEVDQKEAEDESEEEPLVKKRKSPRKKTKHRRIQMESSSDEEQNEAEKLLFGDSQGERLKNISLDDDKVLAEDTIRSDSEHEGLHSDEMSQEKNDILSMTKEIWSLKLIS